MASVVVHRIDDLETFNSGNFSHIKVVHRIDDLENGLHVLFFSIHVVHRIDDLEKTRQRTL